MTVPALRALAAVLATALLLAAGAAADEDFTKEFNSLNLNAIIGGPLQAVVISQGEIMRETMKYIQNVGFDRQTDGNLMARTLDWTYTGYDDDGSAVNKHITLPILCMVPIPYMTVQHVSVELNVKLTSSTSQSTSLSSSSSHTESNNNWWTGSTSSHTASVSSKSTSKVTSERTYSMTIVVTARAGDVPDGMMMILDKMKSVFKHEKPEQGSGSGQTGRI